MPRIVVFYSKENRDPDILQSTETKMQSQTTEREREREHLVTIGPESASMCF